MYNQHFGLNSAPFKITPDPLLFYSGGRRGDILEALVYAVTSGEGIIKVVGEVGVGKTMLCRMLEVRLPENVESVYLANPSLSPEDILEAIALEMGLDTEPASNRLKILRTIQQHLLHKHARNEHVVVLVEEAQSMPNETLEEIRLLSNLETGKNKLLQIVLFGQPELDDKLQDASIRQLRERITHSFRLEPLNPEEVKEYVDFRLRQVGYRGRDAFRRDAYRRIAHASLGLTRRVNILADKSLLAAYAEDTHDVSGRHVHIAAKDSEYAVRKGLRWPEVVLISGGLLLVVMVTAWWLETETAGGLLGRFAARSSAVDAAAAAGRAAPPGPAKVEAQDAMATDTGKTPVLPAASAMAGAAASTSASASERLETGASPQAHAEEAVVSAPSPVLEVAAVSVLDRKPQAAQTAAVDAGQDQASQPRLEQRSGSNPIPDPASKPGQRVLVGTGQMRLSDSLSIASSASSTLPALASEARAAGSLATAVVFDPVARVDAAAYPERPDSSQSKAEDVRSATVDRTRSAPGGGSDFDLAATAAQSGSPEAAPVAASPLAALASPAVEASTAPDAVAAVTDSPLGASEDARFAGEGSGQMEHAPGSGAAPQPAVQAIPAATSQNPSRIAAAVPAKAPAEVAPDVSLVAPPVPATPVASSVPTPEAATQTASRVASVQESRSGATTEAAVAAHGLTASIDAQPSPVRGEAVAVPALMGSAEASPAASTVRKPDAAGPAGPATTSTSAAVSPGAVAGPTLVDRRLAATRTWLQSVNGSHYSIQLLLTHISRRGDLEAFLRGRQQAGELDSVYVYETVINERTWFGVLYRAYATFSEARRALQKLPPELSLHAPFIRNVRDISGLG